MSSIDQMVENVRLARLRVRNLTEELREKGVVIRDYDYGVNPETGQITNLSITVVDGFSREEIESAFARLKASGILQDGLCSIGVGGSLLRGLLENSGDAAFKLHDFGYRRSQ